jgi:hypothetical protein
MPALSGDASVREGECWSDVVCEARFTQKANSRADKSRDFICIVIGNILINIVKI